MKRARGPWFVYVDRTDDGIPFYVGKGTLRRVKVRARDNPKWKAVAAKHGQTREVVFATSCESIAYEVEISLIAELDTMVPRGTNFSRGGEKSQSGLVRSPETRERLRQAHLGQQAWNKGKPQSEEHRRINSESHRGRVRGPLKASTRAKIGARHRARSPWTGAVVAAVIADRANGLLLREIASKHDLSYVGVRNVCAFGKPTMSAADRAEKRAAGYKSPTDRAEVVRRMVASRTPEQFSAAARKAWKTRRAMRAGKATCDI